MPQCLNYHDNYKILLLLFIIIIIVVYEYRGFIFAMAQGRFTASHIAVSGLIPIRAEILIYYFIFLSGIGIMGTVEQNVNRNAFLPNIPGLNPKSIHCAYTWAGFLTVSTML